MGEKQQTSVGTGVDCAVLNESADGDDRVAVDLELIDRKGLLGRRAYTKDEGAPVIALFIP